MSLEFQIVNLERVFLESSDLSGLPKFYLSQFRAGGMAERNPGKG